MKKHFWPGLLIILALTSCTRFYAPGVGGRGHGPRLDTPQSPRIVTILVNNSHETLLVDLQGHSIEYVANFIVVPPGTSLIREERSFQEYHLTIAWMGMGFQDQVGYSREKLYLSMPGLYSGTPLIIDDLMLRNDTVQRGVIYNLLDPTIYMDNQGHSIPLATGDSAYIYLRSGVVNYYTKPAENLVGRKIDDYYSGLRTYQFVVTKKDGQYTFNGQAVDFRIILKERWRWR